MLILIFIVIIKDMYTRIDRSSKRPDTVVEIFFWVDKSETHRRLFKLSCCLMIRSSTLIVNTKKSPGCQRNRLR